MLHSTMPWVTKPEPFGDEKATSQRRPSEPPTVADELATFTAANLLVPHERAAHGDSSRS